MIVTETNHTIDNPIMSIGPHEISDPVLAVNFITQFTVANAWLWDSGEVVQWQSGETIELES